MKEQNYWIIGYKQDLSFVIIGENTGPYSQLPNGLANAIYNQGNFIYIENLTDSTTRTVDIGKPAGKCPFLDDMKRRTPNPDEPFSSLEDCFNYLLGLNTLEKLSKVPSRGYQCH